MPRDRAPEKVKDLKGTLLRLFKNLHKWRYMMVVAAILAMIAAMLSTIAPNKLADVTDVISEGLKPNTEGIEKISSEVYKNIMIGTNTSDYDDAMYKYSNLSLIEKKNILKQIINDKVKISTSDQL